MTILRTLKHWALSPIPVKYSFPEEALGEITQCIEKQKPRPPQSLRSLLREAFRWIF